MPSLRAIYLLIVHVISVHVRHTPCKKNNPNYFCNWISFYVLWEETFVIWDNLADFSVVKIYKYMEILHKEFLCKYIFAIFHGIMYFTIFIKRQLPEIYCQLLSIKLLHSKNVHSTSIAATYFKRFESSA